MYRSASYNSAKNVPRAAFDPQDPMQRIKYIITMAKCFNALAMIEKNRYYSLPEALVTEHRERHRLLRSQKSGDLKEIEEASSLSDESPAITPEKSGADVTHVFETSSSQITSVLYPSPFKSGTS